MPAWMAGEQWEIKSMTSTRKFAAAAFTTIGLVSVFSSAPSYAATRDHRNTAGNTYSTNCRWHPHCTSTSNAQGGVVVTQGAHRKVVVPTRVTPPGGSFGGSVTDHRTKR
jgi:hypothetical protein